MPTTPTTTPPGDPRLPEPVLMRTKDVAALLNTSESAVRWWRHTGEGPAAFKIGGAVRYRRADVEVWLQAQYDATASISRTAGGAA